MVNFLSCENHKKLKLRLVGFAKFANKKCAFCENCKK